MTERRWLVTDKFGRVYRLTVPRRKGPTLLLSRATGPAATVELLAEDAIAPWGRADRHALQDLLEICCLITGRDAWLDFRRLRRGEHGWRERLDRVQEVLSRSVEQGWLLCERVDKIAPGFREEIPSTRREPVAPSDLDDTVVLTADWVEIVLQDGDGRPVANARCSVTLPSGRTVGLTTGLDGRVRLDGIESGVCTVEFPEIEATTV